MLTQTSTACPPGHHTCRQTWTCEHGYTFYRHHNSTSKFETAYKGPDAGKEPCPACTRDYEAREKALEGRRAVLGSDDYLIARLNEELHLTSDWR